MSDGRLTAMLCRLVSNRGRSQKKRRSHGSEARRGRRDWARGREAGTGVREGVSRVTPTGMGGAQRPLTIATVFHRASRWRAMRACHDNAYGESKSQNAHESLMDLILDRCY